MRDGETFLQALRDGREVWLDGERIDDVTAHVKTRGVAQTLASWYDLAPDDRALSWRVPSSVDALQKRADATRRMATPHGGLMGRTPDYLAVLMTGVRQAAAVYGQGDSRFTANIRAAHRAAAARDLCLTHAFANPQTGTAVHVTREDDAGIVLSGARSLATLAPFADEIFSLTLPMQALEPGQEHFCVGFSVPVATPGVKLMCRPSFGKGPLSSRFDELDARVVFDDVHVPWERVLEYRNLALHAHIAQTAPIWRQFLHHAATVNAVKMDLTLGVAHRLATSSGVDRFPHIQEKIAEIIDVAAGLRALRRASEVDADNVPGAEGLWPAAEPLLAMRDTFPEAFARVRQILEQIGASGFFSADPLARLAWDLVGSEFASRQALYARYAFGDPVRHRRARYADYDFSVADAMVDDMLSLGD